MPEFWDAVSMTLLGGYLALNTLKSLDFVDQKSYHKLTANVGLFVFFSRYMVAYVASRDWGMFGYLENKWLKDICVGNPFVVAFTIFVLVSTYGFYLAVENKYTVKLEATRIKTVSYIRRHIRKSKRKAGP